MTTTSSLKAQQVLALVRREIWQHRSLRLLPVFLCGLTLALSLLALAMPQRIEANLAHKPFTLRGGPDGDSLVVKGAETDVRPLLPGLNHSPVRVTLGELSTGNLLAFFAQLPDPVRRQSLLLFLLLVGRTALLPMGLLAVILTLNSFRPEMQDRSIHFFKSMPTSEGQTILSKLLLLGPTLFVAMLATVMVVQLIPLLVATVAMALLGTNPLAAIWSVAPLGDLWLSTLRQLTLDYLLFLPAIAFCMTLNIWNPARRFSALLALVGVALVDRLYLTGGSFAHWVAGHVVPPGWSLRDLGSHTPVMDPWHAGVPAVDWSMLTGGIVVSALLLWAAVHLLRWREEY